MTDAGKAETTGDVSATKAAAPTAGAASDNADTKADAKTDSSSSSSDAAERLKAYEKDIAHGRSMLESAMRHDEKEGWVFNSEMSTGIKVYTRDSPDGGPYMVCGTGIIEASAFSQLRVLFPG